MWVQQGHIFKPSGDFLWSQSHAQVPSCLVLQDRLRIYYTTRDEQGRSRTSFIDLDQQNPSKILSIHDKPVMELGTSGTHDEDGVMVGCIIERDNEIWMYYTGWSCGVTIPYRVSVGLAISNDRGLTFKRAFIGPVVDRTPQEAFMTMSPYVLQDNDTWRMWYGSGTGWVSVDDKQEPLYIIKEATSSDGRTWRQDNITSIPPLHPLEANTRPSVMKIGDLYHMWFSYRDSIDYRDGQGSYRIGHAISLDGTIWQRQDDPPGLSPSGNGWNSHMMAYPNVIQIDGRYIMFHNGNGFGASGFGWSEWIA
ncbi:MAG: hypothetical protein KF798_00955 [Candidatus Paracaedibacteraceae bacterium]|nr:hypothetical protein [Candidatus Paracaedibacteraceae bacterium]